MPLFDNTSSEIASSSSDPAVSSGQPNQKRRNRNRRNKQSKTANNNASGSHSEVDINSDTNTTSGNPVVSNNQRGAHNGGRPNQRVRHADPSRVVRKPQPNNPRKGSKRDQEIELLRRGFPSLEADSNDPTKFRMKFSPSDPDFPFDIQTLDFNLYIPINYKAQTPKEGSRVRTLSGEFPVIVVLNKDIPSGFSVNIDIGFKLLAEKFLKSGRTLLDMIIALDKELEGFLKQGKRETIKIVKMNNNRPKQAVSTSSSISTTANSTSPISFNLDSPPTIFVPPDVKKERQAQIDKLKHSLGKSSMWAVSSDRSEDVYRVTIACKNDTDLPAEMKGNLEFNLHIPASYGIEKSCFVIFPLIVDEFPSNLVENNFNKFLRSHKDWKLFSLVNYLACRIGDLMSTEYEEQESGLSIEDSEVETHNADSTVEAESPVEDSDDIRKAEIQDKARKILSSLLSNRPSTDNHDSEEKSENIETSLPEKESQDDPASSKEMEAEDENIFTLEPIKPRGIALVLPSISMTNIGILECTTINLVVMCDRCGTQNDLFNIMSGPYGRDSKPVASTCTKCKAVLGCSYQKNLLHQNMTSPAVVGYLDMSGCSPADVLGSTFVPTCDNCTVSNPDGSFKRAERQRASTMNCRSCHIRMTLQLGPDGFRFETVTDDKLSEERLKGVRVRKHDANKQKLGLISGSPLPNDGKCTHFRKSTRWFRFSCCGKVYPCEKCHDLESNHPYEHGTRIICGRCSREQNFVNTCAYCRHKFDHRTTSGFWEGGKGTRDPTKLNRNDTRKHKRLSNKTSSSS